MDGVSKMNWIAALSDVENLAFLRMEFHEPLSFPLLECVKVLLELDGIIIVVDDPINHAVVSK